jgi:hypothetical protein
MVPAEGPFSAGLHESGIDLQCGCGSATILPKEAQRGLLNTTILQKMVCTTVETQTTQEVMQSLLILYWIGPPKAMRHETCISALFEV